jgi:hypothetical protein
MLSKLLEKDIARIEDSLSSIVSDYYGLFDYLATLNVKAPPIIRSSAGIVLTANVERALKKDFPDVSELRGDMERSRQWNAPLDRGQVDRALKSWIIKQMKVIYESPSSAARMDMVKDVVELFAAFNWHVDLYEAQNLYYAAHMEIVRWSRRGSPDAQASFRRLGDTLRFAREVLA